MDELVEKMAPMDQWRIAWANIQSDHRDGVISDHQFRKEQEYMREGRIQIERAMLEAGEVK